MKRYVRYDWAEGVWYDPVALTWWAYEPARGDWINSSWPQLLRTVRELNKPEPKPARIPQACPHLRP